MMKITLSILPHTWLIDIDGTIVKHNGHLLGEDQLLPGVLDFWMKIPDNDMIILLSARSQQEAEKSLAFLKSHGLRFNHAIFGLPMGERVLINDIKPSGLSTAISVNLQRDGGFESIFIEKNLSL